MFSIRNVKSTLTSLALCSAFSLAASCGRPGSSLSSEEVGIDWMGRFEGPIGQGTGHVPSGDYAFASCFSFDPQTGVIDFDETIEISIRVEEGQLEDNDAHRPDHVDEHHDHDHQDDDQRDEHGMQMILKASFVKIQKGDTVRSLSFTDPGEYDNHGDHFLVARASEEELVGELDFISFSSVPLSMVELDDKSLAKIPEENKGSPVWQFRSALVLPEVELVEIPGRADPLRVQKMEPIVGTLCQMKNQSWRLSIVTLGGSSH